MAPSLRVNFAWALAGNVVFAGAQWALLVVIAKLGTPVELGHFALALAVTGPIFVLSQLHLRGVLVSDVTGRFSFSQYLSVRRITTLAAAAVTLLLAAGHQREAALTIAAVAAARTFDSLSDIYQALAQQHEHMATVGKSLILKGLLSVALLTGAMLLTGEVFWAACGMSIASLLVLAALDRNNSRLSGDGLRWNLKGTGTLLWTAAPLALVMTLISLNTNIPRYFVEYHRGPADLGIFAALSYLIVAGNTVVGAAAQSLTSRLARHFAAGDKAGFARLLGRIVILAAACGIASVVVAWLAGRPLLTILYRPEYAAHSGLLVGIMAAGAIHYVSALLGSALTAAGEFRSQVPLFVAVSAVTLVTSWLFVPMLGLQGAVTALAAGAVTQLAGSAFLLSRVWRRA